ncbi:MAG: universal stress protein [Pseudomonadota bacterium]|nr:universal stress protein [Pseudomonadota bacterium]
MTGPAASPSVAIQPLPEYRSILLAVDASDLSNHGIREGVGIARLWNGSVTSTHAYAAKMHDMRFRQMEGGLPEQFREEQELERQRDIHDDLISRGLSIITDSYLDQAAMICEKAGVEHRRRSLEGKNYRALLAEANGGDYDLLVMGATGLGAIQGSRIGTVCGRVARRARLDTLVIKDAGRAISKGPIVAAIDGSPRAFGGLLTAFALARHWGAPLQVISAFDPYYHYVAFNRIAGVLSDAAGEVVRFKELEKLHEEIIDSGLANIYQSHLAVAQSMAEEYGIKIETRLLDGKPYDAIEKHLRQVKPSLLVLGKTGIHADAELDIGGNTEHLLHNVECSLLISHREYRPRVDVMAEATTTWTEEADARMARVPEFVQAMARMAILRYARERGHTVITAGIVEQATAELMPGRAEQAMEEIVEASEAGRFQRSLTEKPMQWSGSARQLLEAEADKSLRRNIALRAEKRARGEGGYNVLPEHIAPFLRQSSTPLEQQARHWQAAALARLSRVPEGFMREMSRKRVELYALDTGAEEITLEIAEAGLEQARAAMAAQMEADGKAPVEGAGKCPFGGASAMQPAPQSGVAPEHKPDWSEDARARLQQVPEGYCREMTIAAAEAIAGQQGLTGIDADFLDGILEVFEAGSETVSETLPWDAAAKARIAGAPEMVRGMLTREIEGWARRNGEARVNEAAVEQVKRQWRTRGVFHLDPDDPRSR